MRVFISYSSRDLTFARVLHKQLEARDVEVWRDERRVERDWSREVADALVESDTIVLLWTKASAGSRWVRNEWLTTRGLGKRLELCTLPDAPEIPKPLKNVPPVRVQGRRAADAGRLAAALARKLARPSRNDEVWDFSVLPEQSYVPFAANPYFIGRESNLLDLYLTAVGNLNVLGTRHVGLTGLGGVGKTQLAVEFAHRFGFAFDGGVFWIQAADVRQWRSEFVNIARNRLRLDVDRSDDSGAELAYLYELQRYVKEHPSTLFVMDNVVDPESLHKETPLAPGMTPLSLGGTVLFTTRSTFELPDTVLHRIGDLDPDASLRLLTRYRDIESQDDRTAAQEICSRLGHLPLAIVLTGGYLREYRAQVTFQAYLAALERDRIAAIDSAHMTPAQLATRHEAAIRRTLAGHVAMLKEPVARRLFLLAAQFGEGEIVPSRRLGLLGDIMTGRNPLDQALARPVHRLRDLSLVEVLQTGPNESVRQHPLVRDFARDLIPARKRSRFRADAVTDLARSYLRFTTLDGELRDRGVREVLDDLALTRAWANGRTTAVRDAALLRETLELGASALTNDSRELMVQLRGRLSHTTPALRRLISSAEKSLTRPWIKPLRPTLTPPGSPLVRTFRHQSLTRMAVSRNGQIAITGGYDGDLIVWDLATGRMTVIVPAEGPTVEALGISDDGRVAVAWCSDGTITALDVAEATVIASAVAEPPENSATVAVNSDGTVALLASYTGQLILWHPRDGKKPTVARVKRAKISAYALTPNADLAAFGLDDGSLLIQRPHSVSRRIPVATKAARVRVLKFSPDASSIAIAWNDGRLAMWDTASWTEIWSTEDSDIVQGAAISRDASTLVASSFSDIAVRDASSGKVIASVDEPFGGAEEAAAVTDDGKLAVAGVGDGWLTTLDVSARKRRWRVRAHAQEVQQLTTVSDATHALSASTDGMKMWDLKHRPTVIKSAALSDTVFDLAISKNGGVAAAVDGDGGVAFWELPSLRAHVAREAHAGRALRIVVSDNGRVACSAGAHGAIAVWNPPNTRAITHLAGHEDDDVRALAITPDGSFIASGANDKTVRVWDVRSRTSVDILRDHTQSIDEVAMSADGRRVLSCSGEHVTVWDVGSRNAVRRLEADANVYHVSITEDGTRGVTLDTRGGLVMWDLASGRRVRDLQCSGSNVYTLAVTPDGMLAVADSGADDHGLDVWDLLRGRRLTRLVGHQDSVGALAVTADRQFILSGSLDSTVRVWSLRDGTPLARVTCDFHIRSLASTPNARLILAGDDSGAVHFFEFRP